MSSPTPADNSRGRFRRWRAGVVATVVAGGLGIAAITFAQQASAGTAWPSARGLVRVSATTNVSGTLDGGLTIVGDSKKKISICDRFTGNDTGAEPPKTGSGADGKNCLFSASDLTYK